MLGDEAEDHLAADRRDPADAGHRQQRGDAVLLRTARCRRGSGSPGRRRARPPRPRRTWRCWRRCRRPGPASISQAAFCVISRASSISIWQAASGCARPWWAPIGVPHTVRCRAYSVALRMASRATPVEYAAAITRSGFRPANSCAMPWSGWPDERVGGQPDVVQEQLELLLRADDLHRDRVRGQARGVGGDDEQRGPQRALAAVGELADDEHRVGLVDPADPHLAAG